MQIRTPNRATRTTVVTSVLLLLLAMMLPVCHMHPLLDKSAPEHCAICVTLHAAPPLGIHLPPVVRLYQAGQVVIPDFPIQSIVGPKFAASRAPPFPAC
ncbi:MAG: hypothetical protein V4587_16405 [Acidobacteriota bacterium]